MYHSKTKIIDLDATTGNEFVPKANMKRLPPNASRQGSQNNQKIASIPFTARGNRPEAMRGNDGSMARAS